MNRDNWFKRNYFDRDSFMFGVAFGILGTSGFIFGVALILVSL